MCQFMGNTKWNRTQLFQYVINGYEEDNDQFMERIYWVFFKWVSDICINPEV